MANYSICILLFLLYHIRHCYCFEEPGKYIEKFERSPEREYYKKESDSFPGTKVTLEKDVNYKIEKKYYGDGKENEWRDSKYRESNYKQDESQKRYEREYKNKETKYNKEYDEYYKYKKDKYSYPKKYDGEEGKKRNYPDNSLSESFKDVKHNKHMHSHLREDPPDHTKYIAMSRFVVHQADWASVATVSVLQSIKGFPFTNIVSMSDGTVENSTGIPYFYLTPLDFTHQDISNDNRCTVSVSLAETGYCADKKWEADDPRCARIMLSGKIQRVRNDTTEYEFARNALFTRHPSMANLPADHHFYVAKLKISNIVMLDWFGGPHFIDIKDYLKYKPVAANKNKIFEEFPDFETNRIDKVGE